MLIEYKTYLDVRFANPDQKKHWQLISPFVFSVNGVEFVAPHGFWTDFASIPRVVWPIISPYELGFGPVPHDFGYFTGNRDQEFWDDVFLACMEKDNISWFKRKAAYQAVRTFGSIVYDSYRATNTTHTLVQTTNNRFELRDWSRRLYNNGR